MPSAPAPGVAQGLVVLAAEAIAIQGLQGLVLAAVVAPHTQISSH